jgi:hypothetical protein
MRLRSPIRKRGVHAKRWSRWQEHNRTLVMVRSGWKCEACGTNMRPLEWAHLASRGNVISEPWCSLSELTAALCSSKFAVGCHEQIDRGLNTDLLDSLRSQAVVRLMGTYPELGYLRVDEPLDAIRAAIRQLEANGWTWDGEEIVRLGKVIQL